MKYLVAIVFGSITLVAVCKAYCWQSEPEKVESGQHPPKGCFFEGKLHELGRAFRTESCLDCHCDLYGGFSCCTAYGRPVGYDKKKCKFVFNKQTCSYDLVPNKDPTKKCEEYAMVG
ncbi:beta-microseminoprotein-like [Pseudophryne corroboree]|uniref:beta-microseminoprotein-like n=1 Tax=Pseudophryne corroboree TaxID=495146 RepID=UPI003081FE1B